MNYLVYAINYIETDLDKVKIVVKHSKYVETSINEYDETLEIECRPTSTSTMEIVRDTIKEINNKEIIEPSYPEVYIYSSKENIEKMQNNTTAKYKANIEKALDQAHQENQELQNEIIELEDKLVEKDDEIEKLKMQIHDLQVEMDSNDLIIVE